MQLMCLKLLVNFHKLKQLSMCVVFFAATARKIRNNIPTRQKQLSLAPQASSKGGGGVQEGVARIRLTLLQHKILSHFSICEQFASTAQKLVKCVVSSVEGVCVCMQVCVHVLQLRLVV